MTPAARQSGIPTVVLVWRTGGEYTEAYVVALIQQVRAWWPVRAVGWPRIVVLTDAEAVTSAVWQTAQVERRPLTASWHRGRLGWWAKMEMFAPQHDDLGPIFYLDVDTVLVGDLAVVIAASAWNDAPVLLSDFYHPNRVQSGLMHWPVEARRRTWAAFSEDPHREMMRVRGDGEFLDMLWRVSAARWQVLVPNAVLSYKAHIRQRPGQSVPFEAAIVCFHGRPRPWASPLWSRYTNL